MTLKENMVSKQKRSGSERKFLFWTDESECLDLHTGALTTDLFRSSTDL